MALAFGFREKRQLWLLLGVNFATQLGLNLALAFTVYKHGGWAETALYVVLELVVFAVEAAIYATVLPRLSGGKNEKKRHPILYALAANAASFGVGLALAEFFPKVF